MSYQTLTTAINHLKETKSISNFNDFIVTRMGFHLTEENTENLLQRRNAYKEFRKRTKKEPIASLPTMKRWFGINGYSTPDRIQVYQMCFAMELSLHETQEYLYYGLHQPPFQVNDYQEVIFAYGLNHRCHFHECLHMIHAFENKLEPRWSPIQTQGTQMLLDEFWQHKNLKWTKFMEWMLERSAFFKGYSKTTLIYFTKYKKLIINYIKQDAKKELEMLLSETDYTFWCKLHPFLPAEPENKVRKYLSYRIRKGELPSDLQKNIKELLNIAFTPLNPNTFLLAELYGVKGRNMTENSSTFSMIPTMTQKKLSDLLNIPIQRQRYLLTKRALHNISPMDDSLPCPEWIQKMALEYPRKTKSLQTIGDARIWLENYQSENKRRCLQIGRSDLLPMVLYVAQRRYLESIGYDMERYEQNSALEEFECLANSTLAACNMASLNETYGLDALLRLCYQKEDMYSYAELLEATSLSLKEKNA